MEYGICLMGDIPLQEVVENAKLAEESGIQYFWIGDTVGYKHPFPILVAVSEATKKAIVGTGIVSPFLHRCVHIAGAFETLKELYGDRFAIGLGTGGVLPLSMVGIRRKGVIKKLEGCIDKLRNTATTSNIPIFVGCSGPKLIEFASKNADGILLNYINPNFVEWALQYVKTDVTLAAYGPSLILPDPEMENYFELVCAIVASEANRNLQKDFKITNTITGIQHAFGEGEPALLEKYKNFLYENFALCGSVSEIEKKITSLRKLGIKQIVFGYPMGRSKRSLKKLKETYMISS